MGVFDAVNKFAAKATIRESKDEMLLGELIRAMSRRRFIADNFLADDGSQMVRFRSPREDVLDYLWVGLDQWAGSGRMSSKLVGARASLRLNGEVKLQLTDPDDLVAVWRTAAANALRVPALGQVKLKHRVTTVSARMVSQINIDDYVLQGEAGTDGMISFLDEKVGEIREVLRPYARPIAAA